MQYAKKRTYVLASTSSSDDEEQQAKAPPLVQRACRNGAGMGRRQTAAVAAAAAAAVAPKPAGPMPAATETGNHGISALLAAAVIVADDTQGEAHSLEHENARLVKVEVSGAAIGVGGAAQQHQPDEPDQRPSLRSPSPVPAGAPAVAVTAAPEPCSLAQPPEAQNECAPSTPLAGDMAAGTSGAASGRLTAASGGALQAGNSVSGQGPEGAGCVQREASIPPGPAAAPIAIPEDARTRPVPVQASDLSPPPGDQPPLLAHMPAPLLLQAPMVNMGGLPGVVPEPVPITVPAPMPVPAPIPAAGPVPMPVSAPMPASMPASSPALMPDSIPASVPAPEPAVASASVAAPGPMPAFRSCAGARPRSPSPAPQHESLAGLEQQQAQPASSDPQAKQKLAGLMTTRIKVPDMSLTFKVRAHGVCG